MHSRHSVPGRWIWLSSFGGMLLTAGACGDDAGTSPTGGQPRRATLTVVSGDRQTGEVGTLLSQPLVVALRDTLGNPVARVVVRFHDETGAVGDSATTDERGMASARWTLGPTARAQRITAAATLHAGTAYTLADVSFTATAVVGPPARIRLDVAQDFGRPGSILDTVAAIVMDRFDNRVAGVPIGWRVERGEGSVRTLSAVTDAQGLAHAVWTLGAQPGDNVLVAMSEHLIDRLTVFASHGFPATSVVVGGAHTCALTRSGAAYCWGGNMFGQLGTGSMDDVAHTSPTRVAGNLMFAQLVAGTFHTCGLTSDGAVHCWGGNESGQLGRPEGGGQASPTRIDLPSRVTVLAAGGHHTCGLTVEPMVHCWGSNTVGELGDGADRSMPAGWLLRSTPAPIVGGMSFTTMVAAYHATCAIATTGQAYCWGGNSGRELGTSAGNCRMLPDFYYFPDEWDWPCSTRPLPIELSEPMIALTASGYGICGLTADRRLFCWGGSTGLLPTRIPGVTVSTAWSLGHIVCGLEATDTVSCWGLWGATSRTPPPFGDAVTLVNLSSNGSTSCGVSRAQPPVAYCWGHNSQGQLGDGTTLYRETAVAVSLPRRR